MGDLRQPGRHRARRHARHAVRRRSRHRDQPGSILGARFDRIIGLLNSKTEKAERGERVEKHILITRYDAQRAARGEMLNIEDVLDILSVPLLGVIPESEEVLRASNVGSPVTLNNPASAPARAYLDAARRLAGTDVPMTIPIDRKGLLNMLLGGRAA